MRRRQTGLQPTAATAIMRLKRSTLAGRVEVQLTLATNPRMSRQQLIRWGGFAAMLAGALRTATSFWPSAEPGVALELLYLVIDLLILFGVLGIYGFQSEHIGSSGVLGFLLAVIGTAILTGPDGRIGTVNMYAAGSLCLGVGLVFLAVASWTARTLPRWVAVLWVVSTVVGMFGALASIPGFFLISGVTFGVAFIGAGAAVWLACRPEGFTPTKPGSHPALG